jgi:protein TonB
MWYPDPATARLRHEKEARMLYACVGVSIALHGLAMLPLPQSRPAQRPDEATVLTALFAASPEPVAAVPLPTPRKVREPRQPEIPATVQKSPEPAPVVVPQAAGPSASPVSPELAPSQAIASAATPAPVKLPVEGPEPGLLDAYRLALIDAAKRYKRYPVQAMERGWEGRVEIRVVVDANGTIKSALVKSSSRYQILDDQALKMVRKAFDDLAQSRPAPRGREFTVDVPVVFELQTG